MKRPLSDRLARSSRSCSVRTGKLFRLGGPGSRSQYQFQRGHQYNLSGDSRSTRLYRTGSHICFLLRYGMLVVRYYFVQNPGNRINFQLIQPRSGGLWLSAYFADGYPPFFLKKPRLDLPPPKIYNCFSQNFLRIHLLLF